MGNRDGGLPLGGLVFGSPSLLVPVDMTKVSLIGVADTHPLTFVEAGRCGLFSLPSDPTVIFPDGTCLSVKYSNEESKRVSFPYGCTLIRGGADHSFPSGSASQSIRLSIGRHSWHFGGAIHDWGRFTIRAERGGQPDPQSLVVQSVSALIGCSSSIAGKFP